MQPWALIDRDEQEDYLGVFGAVWNLVPAKLTSEVLGQCVSIYTWTAVSTSPTRILPINNSTGSWTSPCRHLLYTRAE
jgi:hypothetical protein